MTNDKSTYLHLITKISELETQLAKTQWLNDKENTYNAEQFIPYYGDVTELNTERTILDGVGKKTLKSLTSELMDLLDTSIAVYEKNGDYAYGVFNSGWCRLLDAASRKICNTTDNNIALNCGKWLCHDKCWSASKSSIEERNTIVMDCVGGLTLFAEPIIAGNEVIGSISIGYGNPPTDDSTLKELSEKFSIDFDTLKQKAIDYKPRPDFIFQIAKKRLKSVARLIGETIYNKQIERQLIKQISEFATLTEQYKKTNEELKIAKEKAEKNEKLLIDLMNNSTAIVYMLDLNKRFMAVNQIVSQIFNRSIQEIIGRTRKDILPDEIIEQHEKNDRIVIQNMKPVSFEETAKIDNQLHIFYTQKFPLIDSSGILYGIGGISTDITEFKNVQNELIKAKEKAEESDRLKTAFLQNMSHEIRTPLNAICGFSGFLNNPDLSIEKRKNFVQIIQNSSNQLLSIVTNILTISSLETKQEKISINKVCINNIIVELLAIFKQQTINQNISLFIKQQLNDSQSEIYTDRTKITQILSNLITNALKFTHEGFIEFGYEYNEPELRFFVRDTGIGIKPEYQDKIFERFRQADLSINKKYGGTGLGLAISKAFVELLGGKIWVQSEPDKGSTFYFTIPYHPVNQTDIIIPPAHQKKSFKTILVAEDEEYNFLLIEEMLIDFKINLIHTKDGQETIDIFKSNPNIDLILMDIKMPIMAGDEAALIIKSIKPDVPIVAQSAYALEHEIDKFSKIFDDYLPKPINGETLTEILLKHIGVKK